VAIYVRGYSFLKCALAVSSKIPAKARVRLPGLAAIPVVNFFLRLPASFTFDDQLDAQRDRIKRELRQLDTASDINSWLSSPDLRSPE
jgi:hypothetical protein